MAIGSLDLFSTSQTEMCFFPVFEPISTDAKEETTCIYHAPFFAYPIQERAYALVQGNCHHWDCPRCGVMRARAEYARIVAGCRQIALSHEISFITLTCRGRELSRRDADDNYMRWTNRFLTAARARARRKGEEWIYVQVTERQRRGHPHSHILSIFDPGDLVQASKKRWQQNREGGRVYENESTLRSQWIAKEVVSCGLGNQYDISIAETVEGASRYVAKYLFKPTMFDTVWPKGWKRVRYSHSFPKLPKRKTDALVLIRAADWYNLAIEADTLRVSADWIADIARRALEPYPTRVISVV